MNTSHATAVPPLIRRSHTVDPASTSAFPGPYARSRATPSGSITAQELGDVHTQAPCTRSIPIGESTLEYTLRWRISPWSSLLQNTEYQSPQAMIDDLLWSIKLFKGRLHNPKVLSVYLGCDDPMLGVYRRVRITFQVENASNPRAQSYALPEQPVWFSSQHLTWGEAHLLDMETVDSLVYEDILLVSVHVQILQSVNDWSAPLPDPLSILYSNDEFADTTLRVTWDNVNFVQFHVHRAVLACQSTYFAHLLYNPNFSEGSSYPLAPTDRKVITLQDTNPDDFRHLVEFFYRASSMEKNSKLAMRSRPHPDLDFMYHSLSFDDLSACMELAHRYQVPLWTQMLLCTARLRVQDSTVWDIWRLGELYHCDATVARAKAHIAANFNRISTTLIHWKPLPLGGNVNNELVEAHSHHEATSSEQKIDNAHSDDGDHHERHPLSKILAVQTKQVLGMDPLNVDSEEQVFLFFSHWVQHRFIDFNTLVPNPLHFNHTSRESFLTEALYRHARTPTDPFLHQTACSRSSTPVWQVSTNSPIPSPPTDLQVYSANDPHNVMNEMVQLIRWPLMQKEFLVFTIPKEHTYILSWPNVREVLRETYRTLLACDLTGADIPLKPRKVVHNPSSWLH